MNPASRRDYGRRTEQQRRSWEPDERREPERRRWDRPVMSDWDESGERDQGRYGESERRGRSGQRERYGMGQGGASQETRFGPASHRRLEEPWETRREDDSWRQRAQGGGYPPEGGSYQGEDWTERSSGRARNESEGSYWDRERDIDFGGEGDWTRGRQGYGAPRRSHLSGSYGSSGSSYGNEAGWPGSYPMGGAWGGSSGEGMSEEFRGTRQGAMGQGGMGQGGQSGGMRQGGMGYGAMGQGGMGQSGMGQGGMGTWQSGMGQGQYGQRQSRGQFYGRPPKGYTRSDERIREDICDRLMQQGEIDPSDISVRVEKGEVTLEGTVGERHWKYEVEEFVDEVSGVKEVINNLRYKRQGAESSELGSSQRSSQEEGGLAAGAVGSAAKSQQQRSTPTAASSLKT